MSDTAAPASPPAFWKIPDHQGADYKLALGRLHQQLRPRRYLEIGMLKGDTLKLAKCPTIGIDPAIPGFDKETLAKPACLLFQMTSDAFFEQYSPTALLGGPLDMAFLDGMHLFEFLLRDFINTERHCRRNAVVLMHDCLPTDAHAARRRIRDETLAAQSAHPVWWAGDVWKTALILRRRRPDLVIHAFDAAPTGLLAITNLEPGNGTLARAYYDLVAEYSDLTMDQLSPEAYLREMAPQRFSGDAHDIAGLFWM